MNTSTKTIEPEPPQPEPGPRPAMAVSEFPQGSPQHSDDGKRTPNPFLVGDPHDPLSEFRSRITGPGACPASGSSNSYRPRSHLQSQSRSLQLGPSFLCRKTQSRCLLQSSTSPFPHFPSARRPSRKLETSPRSTSPSS